jgi:hypothetical protein
MPQPEREPSKKRRELHIVFDRLPCPEGSTFVEVEDAQGKSVNVGEWRVRKDGYAELVITELPEVED